MDKSMLHKVITLDVETTGLPPKAARYDEDFMDFPYIVSLAYKIGFNETKYFIINQEGRKIPPEATAIHGITDEMAAASPHTLGMVLLMMAEDAKGTELTAGHNIYFDSSTIKANVLRMIKGCQSTIEFYDRLCVILHKDRRLDTMRSSVKLCGLNGKWPKLTELYWKLFNEVFNAHNSKDDVDATHKCLVELVSRGIM